MSGQGNLLDFEVFGSTDDAMGAVIIAGIPIASGAPTDGQVISYSAADKVWEYSTLPISNVFAAQGTASTAVSAGVDIDMATDGVIEGTSITRETPSDFSLQPGTYRLQFQVQAVTFTGATTGTESVSYRFYNNNTFAAFGPTGQAAAFGISGASGLIGTTLETIVQSSALTSISVRTISVTGAAPVMVSPAINIYKLN